MLICLICVGGWTIFSLQTVTICNNMFPFYRLGVTTLKLFKSIATLRKLTGNYITTRILEAPFRKYQPNTKNQNQTISSINLPKKQHKNPTPRWDEECYRVQTHKRFFINILKHCPTLDKDLKIKKTISASKWFGVRRMSWKMCFQWKILFKCLYLDKGTVPLKWKSALTSIPILKPFLPC